MRIQILVVAILISSFVVTGCRSRRHQKSVVQETANAGVVTSENSYWAQWDNCGPCDCAPGPCDCAPDSVYKGDGLIQFYDNDYDSSAIDETTRRIRSNDGLPGNLQPLVVNPPPLQNNSTLPGDNAQNTAKGDEEFPTVPSAVIPDENVDSQESPSDRSLEPGDNSSNMRSDTLQDNQFVGSGQTDSELEVEKPTNDVEPPPAKKLSGFLDKMQNVTQPNEDKKTEQGKSGVSAGVSGGASISTNNRFETFRLSDLFAETEQNKHAQPPKSDKKDDVNWGPPVAVEMGSDKKSETPESNENDDRLGTDLEADDDAAPGDRLKINPPQTKNQLGTNGSDNVLELLPKRSEAEIVRSLRNSKVPNRIVFDPTAPIPEQEIPNTQIVLTARPSEYYHEIRRIAENRLQQQSDPTTQHQQAVEQFDTSVGNGVPVLQASTIIGGRSISLDFRPLPELNELMRDEGGVGADDPATRDVFAPVSFPRINSQQESDNGNDLEPNGDGATMSQPPISHLPAIPDNISAPPSRLESSDSFGDSEPIILRAAPKQDDDALRNSVSPNHSNATKATFRFVQPKFQRVVEEE